MAKTITDVAFKERMLAGEGEVRVRTIVGDGQSGGWVVLLSGKRIHGGEDAAWKTVGKASKLRGRHIEVSAFVMDVRKETDRLTVSVEVTGPSGPATRAKITHVGDPGDNGAYSFLIHFPKGA